MIMQWQYVFSPFSHFVAKSAPFFFLLLYSNSKSSSYIYINTPLTFFFLYAFI
ncbi:uncharacterized protein BX664DRAFT_336456 [Halteromyces radiatus]|uniref:uncharacterized protein n=1 Tax=Halteromyces radiatus TaxID=101107 RepID=UPI002220DB77|nr:uncharacterized protein BX664DRAFT_336456 [Halteromyces radiatus]KAI8086665.1 hypothetical protein BX664DRAFT_336456 [Halteromyces radiatus]